MLINSVRDPTYLLRVLQLSPSRSLYNILSRGGASMTMLNIGKRFIPAKQNPVKFTHPTFGFHMYIIQTSRKIICHEVEDLGHGVSTNGLNIPWVLSHLRLIIRFVLVSL